MAKVVRREIRKRGFFGWVFLLVFLAFNLFMAAWLFSYWSLLSDQTAVTQAQQAGKAIGGALGTGTLVVLWLFGSIITGLLALLTRGGKTIVEEYQ